MRNFATVLSAAALVSGMVSAAGAADIAVPYRPPVVAPVVVTGGWYLRGDLGVGIADSGKWREPEFDAPPPNYTGRWIRQSIDNNAFYGAGIGYKFNDWLRGDLTAQYRTAVNLRGTGNVNGLWAVGVTGDAYAQLQASVSSAVFMANGYVDIGSQWGITPYVGVGLGTSYNMFQGGHQINTIPTAGGNQITTGNYGDKSSWDFAWALHAGLTYDVSDRLKIDAGYSYLNLGNAGSGALVDLNTASGPKSIGDKWKVPDLVSHDLRLGFRYMLDQPVAAPAPVMAKY
jgi:opacity protein-like surface antigen